MLRRRHAGGLGVAHAGAGHAGTGRAGAGHAGTRRWARRHWAHGRWASGRVGTRHMGHKCAAQHARDTTTRRLCAAIRPTRHPRHGAGQAATRPRARGQGATYARRLSCGCAHGALGQFLTQYCF